MNQAERISAIESLRSTPASVRQAVEGLNAEQLATPYRDGGWSVAQVVHHIADSHLHAYVRMKLILELDRPTLQPYDQDVWARMHDASDTNIESSMKLIDGLHSRWAEHLATLSEPDWTRIAYHPERGDLSMDDMLRIYSRHGANHVRQINDLRSRMGW